MRYDLCLLTAYQNLPFEVISVTFVNVQVIYSLKTFDCFWVQTLQCLHCLISHWPKVVFAMFSYYNAFFQETYALCNTRTQRMHVNKALFSCKKWGKFFFYCYYKGTANCVIFWLDKLFYSIWIQLCFLYI